MNVFLALALLIPTLTFGADADPNTTYLNALQSIQDERNTDAAQELKKTIAQLPQHAGAWLDSAILQCQLGNKDESIHLLDEIEQRFKPPQAIQEVIQKVRAMECPKWHPQGHLSMLLGRGNSSNINQGPSSPNFILGSGINLLQLQLLPQYLKIRDNYTAFSTAYSSTLTPNGVVGLVQLQTVNDDSATQYNIASLLTGFDFPWRYNNWKMDTSITLAAYRLGDALYQEMSQIQEKMTRPLNERLSLSFMTDITHNHYNTISSFDSNTYGLRSQLIFEEGGATIQTNLAYLFDPATGGRPGGNRQGWLGGISGRRPLWANTLGELGWNVQTWNSANPYTPGLIDQIRQQQIQLLRGALVLPLTKQQALRLEWRSVKNDGNIPIFNYDSQQVQLNWEWQTGL